MTLTPCLLTGLPKEPSHAASGELPLCLAVCITAVVAAALVLVSLATHPHQLAQSAPCSALAGSANSAHATHSAALPCILGRLMFMQMHLKDVKQQLSVVPIASDPRLDSGWDPSLASRSAVADRAALGWAMEGAGGGSPGDLGGAGIRAGEAPPSCHDHTNLAGLASFKAHGVHSRSTPALDHRGRLSLPMLYMILCTVALVGLPCAVRANCDTTTYICTAQSCSGNTYNSVTGTLPATATCSLLSPTCSGAKCLGIVRCPSTTATCQKSGGGPRTGTAWRASPPTVVSRRAMELLGSGKNLCIPYTQCCRCRCSRYYCKRSGASPWTCCDTSACMAHGIVSPISIIMTCGAQAINGRLAPAVPAAVPAGTAGASAWDGRQPTA